MRVVGLDIHRVFAEAVMLEDGAVRRLGRIGMTRDHLAAFARTLTREDHVVVEASGNASAVAEVIRPHVGRVVIANPRQVRLIAKARVKTVGHPHAIERPIEISSPERQELVALAKARGEFIHTLRRPSPPGSKAQELGRLTIDRDPIAFALRLNLPLAIAGRHRDLAGSSTARPEIG
jgi:hypothetical protein